MPPRVTAPPLSALPPLFMWAGGKRRLLPKYAPFLPDMAGFSAYVEPFLGGGAVFSWAAFARPGLKAVLGDVNEELIGLYAAIKSDPEAMIKAVQGYERRWMPKAVEQRKAYYYELREAYWAMPLSLASSALLYFLMKTGFNGIWQTCVAAKGRYGTPVGLAQQKVRVVDPELMRSWSKALEHVHLQAQGFEATEVPNGSFVYCDPPYRDSFTSYSTGFSDADHDRLIQWCRSTAEKTKSLVWLSNRDAGDGFFAQHAPDAQTVRIPVIYTAGRRKRTEAGFEAKPATEVLLRWDGRR